jgi:hypothetical protein
MSKKNIMENIFKTLDSQRMLGKLSDLELATFGQFIALLEIFDLLNKTNLESMQIISEIKDKDAIKREVDLQNEIFYRKFQSSIKNMWKNE